MSITKILIVDDSATSRMIIKRCLELAGYRECSYFEAEDGLKALSLLGGQPVDLIVTDIKMPKMDGVTFIRKVKINDSIGDTPIIVISSLGNEALEDQLQEAGVKAVIKKPISPAKIVEALGEG